MKNFIYDVPTRILFGENQVSNVGKEALSFVESTI